MRVKKILLVLGVSALFGTVMATVIAPALWPGEESFGGPIAAAIAERNQLLQTVYAAR